METVAVGFLYILNRNCHLEDSDIKKVNIIVFLYLSGKRYSKWNIVKKFQDFMNISIIIIANDQNIIHITEVSDSLVSY